MLIMDGQFLFHNTLVLETVVHWNAAHKRLTIPPIQKPYMNVQLRKAINIKGMLKHKYDNFKTQKVKKTKTNKKTKQKNKKTYR